MTALAHRGAGEQGIAQHATRRSAEAGGPDVPDSRASLDGGRTHAAASRPADPRLVAAAAGLPGAREGQVIDLSRSHRVHRVDSAAGSVIVKAAAQGSRRGSRTLSAEAFAYRLAGWRPGLAAVLPRATLIDESRQVLVLEAAPWSSVGGVLQDRGLLPDPAASFSLGHVLASVHLATAGIPIPFATSAGILDLPDSEPSDIDLVNAKELALAVSHDPVLAAGLRRARADWAPTCLVHGDVKWDNCLVDLDVMPPVLRLIDWELSGWGDPAWDIAAALAQATALEVTANRSGEPGQAALVAGYVARAGTGIIERTARYWPARLVHLALECAEGGALSVADSLLERARDLMRHEPETGERLWGWTG